MKRQLNATMVLEWLASCSSVLPRYHHMPMVTCFSCFTPPSMLASHLSYSRYIKRNKECTRWSVHAWICRRWFSDGGSVQASYLIGGLPAQVLTHPVPGQSVHPAATCVGRVLVPTGTGIVAVEVLYRYCMIHATAIPIHQFKPQPHAQRKSTILQSAAWLSRRRNVATSIRFGEVRYVCSLCTCRST